MGIPKGAKIDRATGRYIMPEGFQKKTEAQKRALASPSAQAERAEDRFNRERKAARNISYRLYAIHPSGKYWLQDVQEVNLAMIANNFGGGRYEAWKFDSSTGELSGDPVPYNVDPTVYPVRGGDPATSGRASIQGPPAYGGGGFFQGPQQHAPGFGPPASWMAPPPAANSKAISDLEDEIEDLEDELAKANGLSAMYLRERDEARAQLADQKALIERKELQAAFELQLQTLKAGLEGKKDPLDQMLAFSRLQAELNGGVIGKGGSPTDTITLAMGLMNTILTAAKSLPTSESPGGALGGLIQVANQYLPLISKMVEGKASAPAQVVDERRAQAAPAPQPPVPPQAPPAAPAPDPEVVKAFAERLKECVEAIPAHTAGAPEAFADWIVTQSGPGWPDVHSVIALEKPEAFLEEVVKVHKPELLDTDLKKQWIVQAIASAQGKLLAAKAKG